MPARSTVVILLVILTLGPIPVAGQRPLAPRPEVPVFTDALPPAEFADRRARLMAAIGDGVAVLQGAAEKPAEAPFRQNTQFFALTGVEVPRAILVVDGKAKRSTLFIPDYSRRERQYGPMLWPDADAPRITGIEAVQAREAFAAAAQALAGRVVYTPLRPEVLGSGSSFDAIRTARASTADPWDGRPSREEAFAAKLRALRDTAVKDLDPVIDGLRAIKSPREIALIREATRIAGLGIMEAMRDARPGMHEYELQADAEFVFTRHGAQGAAYFALVATGTNTLYTHYHKGTAVLADGDLVQFDYAPDYHYYVSDVTRVFPANGRFTPRQRELYTIYLRLYQALMTSIRPNVAPREIIRTAVGKMDAVMAGFAFTDAAIEAAATQFVERYHRSTANELGHTVGLEVHDVPLGSDVLKPGHLFTIEPALILEGEHLGIRLEDVLLVTDTGYENLSASVPVEIADIEALMAQPGLSDAALTPGR
jgi:Xaa-Pro aminopeptidase